MEFRNGLFISDDLWASEEEGEEGEGEEGEQLQQPQSQPQPLATFLASEMIISGLRAGT